MLYNANGSINVTVVNGSALTGLYAADGSWNVVIRDGNSLTGLQHPCGAFNVVVATNQLGLYHRSGAMLVTEDLTNNGGPQHVDGLP